MMWPWQKNKKRIQDLRAHEVAAYATASWKKSGRQVLCARLIYRTLELNPFQPQALLMLAEIYRGKTTGVRPVGDESFAGIVVEYAVDSKSSLTMEQKRPFDQARSEVMALWGFAKKRGTEWDIDHIGYMTHINEVSAAFSSLTNGFQYALVKLGVQAGFLDPKQGVTTQAYQAWLHSDASTLAAPEITK